MKVTGIITEYNPFHNGHYHHIREARTKTRADYIVVVMSGNFVQRGTPAIMDKYLRTKICLAYGADLVLELPVQIATSSAESFAYGSISLLDKLGVIDYICFGSEAGSLEVLKPVAGILNEEPLYYKNLLKQELKKGSSYPVARSNALLSLLSLQGSMAEEEKNTVRKVLQSSNNILGIEYIKALLKRNSRIIPVTIERTGASYHDISLSDTISSASGIRNALKETDSLQLVKPFMPSCAFKKLKESYGRAFPIWEDDFSLLLHCKLLQEKPSSLFTYADVSEELAKRIQKHLYSFTSFTQFSQLLKTKELTHTRINRALLHILLNIRKAGSGPKEEIPYSRILGFKKESTNLLNEIKKASELHLIAKLADAKNYLTDDALTMLEKDIYAADIYHAVMSNKFNLSMPNEYTIPIIKI